MHGLVFVAHSVTVAGSDQADDDLGDGIEIGSRIDDRR